MRKARLRELPISGVHSTLSKPTFAVLSIFHKLGDRIPDRHIWRRVLRRPRNVQPAYLMAPPHQNSRANIERINTSTTKAIDNRRSTLTDSLSVTKITGKGPIITKPPPLTRPFSRKALKNRRKTATKMMTNPTRIKMTPTAKSSSPLIPLTSTTHTIRGSK